MQALVAESIIEILHENRSSLVTKLGFYIFGDMIKFQVFLSVIFTLQRVKFTPEISQGKFTRVLKGELFEG